MYVDTLFDSLCLASTSPGDCSKIPADQIRRSSEVDRNDPNLNVVEVPGDSKKLSFKEKVFGECSVMQISLQIDILRRLCEGMMSRFASLVLFIDYPTSVLRSSAEPSVTWLFTSPASF